MARNKENPPEQPEEAKPTQRVVLQRAQVMVVAEGVPDDVLKAAQDLLRGAVKGENAMVTQAWIERGTEEGDSKDDSIEAYAGKAGTPDAKPGIYKAVPVKSFAGGMELAAPPKPLVEKKPID